VADSQHEEASQRASLGFRKEALLGENSVAEIPLAVKITLANGFVAIPLTIAKKSPCL
jgi:hypothetical protein